MEQSSFSERIHFHYENDPEARMRVAHGVWGGVNPHGEIEMCFYDENSMLPTESVQEIDNDGLAGEERILIKDQDRHLCRNIHTRLLLNYNTARAVLDWLETRINELDSQATTEIYNDNAGPKQ